jgi:Ca-activated chloride channel family protein
MRHVLTLVLCLLPTTLFAQGVLMPRDRNLGPMALVDHRVSVKLDDQVAVTTVKQTFQNPHPRDLEAIYTFTVPKGASVKEFSMTINGKKVKGELVEAPKAKAIYTEIVRRTQDPGLLEYIGTDILQMSVFPVPARGRQEVEVSFTSLAAKNENTVEYLYPLRTNSGVFRAHGEMSFEMELKSSKVIHSIYSPTHPISFSRKSDRHAVVHFDKSGAVSDRDLQLFYTTGKDDIGLTLLQHRPEKGDGYFLLLLAPRAEIKEDQRVPRDMVFVLDTSGSMREDGKLDQAKKALKWGLDSLKPGDRFNILNFATTVNRFQDSLVDAKDKDAGKKWVDALEPTGGTAIDDALKEALTLQTSDRNRSFTIIFFTDGKPTVGEVRTDRILKNFNDKAKENTRIFSFGVGFDLDAAFIDRLAEKHKGTSSFVRPNEDMEIKVSTFFNQINQPVLTDLKLATGYGPRLVEIYPPQLPDLFHGGQLVILGRYQGTGKALVKLTGQVGSSSKEFNYEVDFQEKPDAKAYVEDLWARRKVGYLLDQLRTSGEKKELVDEVTLLAKKYGIATPYTSYLVVPDDVPVPTRPQPRFAAGGQEAMFRGMGGGGGGMAVPPSTRGGGLGGGLGGLGGGIGVATGDGAGGRALTEAERRKALKDAAEQGASKARDEQLALEEKNQFQREAQRQRPGESGQASGKGAGAEFRSGSVQGPLQGKHSLDAARQALGQGQLAQTQQNQTGVDYSVNMNSLKSQSQLARSAQRRVQGRNCIEVNGVWIDDQFKKDTPTLEIRSMSDGYFKLLEKRPELKEVFQLGNALVWITPSGTALVIDPTSGKETLNDDEIAKLFVAKK